MLDTSGHAGSGRVLLLEPNAALRSAIVDVLAAEQYDVERCDSLDEVLESCGGSDCNVALVAWQRMDGLLAEEHRDHLAELTRRLRLILMVPRAWARMLEVNELGVAALVPKPFDADELIGTVRQAMLHPLAAEPAALSSLD
ncbi:MAG: response regulator transcription factor [Chloroflexi bacterium]|nr:response regulator transcription factor [Chloroflexota bacterium]